MPECRHGFGGRSAPPQSFWAPVPSLGSECWPRCHPGQLGAPGGCLRLTPPHPLSPRLPVPALLWPASLPPRAAPYRSPPGLPCSIHVSPHSSLCSPHRSPALPSTCFLPFHPSTHPGLLLGGSAWTPAPGQARWSLDGASVPVFLLDVLPPPRAARTRDSGHWGQCLGGAVRGQPGGQCEAFTGRGQGRC